jgi:glutamine---fructose-6-phosphate transaminase (isomerizing)
MCGIVGIVSKNIFSVKENLISSLLRLEYRGYDSVGFATSEGILKKSIGYITPFYNSIDKSLESFTAIAHTRWATHGKVNKINAHPHTNKKKNIFIVHNGIIENFQEIKNMLELEDYKFLTETDSEVISNYFDYYSNKNKTIEEIISKAYKDFKGTFAILIILKNKNIIYAMKKLSPLVLGITDDSFYVASDIYAFSNKTNKSIFFEDGEYAIITKNDYSFFNEKGEKIKKKIDTFKIYEDNSNKESFKHYMIKEIKEQPKSSSRLIESIKLTQKDLFSRFSKLIKSSSKVVFIACGTSYHASLVGVHLLRRLGIEAHAIIASEFENFFLVDKKTLVIILSQSGETMDIVSLLKDIKDSCAKIASIVNVPYSTIERMSDLSIQTLAGPEISVASTKVFTNQIISLLGLAKELGYNTELKDISKNIKRTILLNEEKIKIYSKELKNKKDIFIIGRGLSYPISREIALKLKEIPYIHAEGMMAGELKHGTIALIEPGVPVISLISNNNIDMLSNTKEVEARGADVYIISNTTGHLIVPKCDEIQFAIYASIIGHLLSYYIADLKGLPIDKPRNLAKSVTVK